MTPIKPTNYPMVSQPKYEMAISYKKTESKTATLAQSKLDEKATTPSLQKGPVGLKNFLKEKVLNTKPSQ